jgi:hypothetical protein
MNKLAAIATCTVALLLVVGCGSSGSSGSSGSGQLSDAAFTQKANAICSAANTANANISQSGAVAALKSEEALVANTVSKLAALKAPSDRAAAFSSYLTDVKYVDKVLLELQAAAKAHDTAKIASIEAGVAGYESKGKAAAKAAGIPQCD